MKNFNNKKSHAFTLVEMLVVLGMISILMGVTFTGIGSARSQAKIVKANAEVRTLMNAWLAYESSFDEVPAEFKGGEEEVLATKENIGELLGLPPGSGKDVFLNVQMLNGAFRDPWGNPYKFRLLSKVEEDSALTDYFDAAVTFPNRHRSVAP